MDNRCRSADSGDWKKIRLALKWSGHSGLVIVQFSVIDELRNLEKMNTLQGVPLEHHSNPAAVSRANPERSLQLALAAARVAAENRGTDVAVLDMTESAAWVDYFVIATGTSRRQLHAMSEEIDHKLEDDLGDKRMNIDGYDESKWIVLDYGSVIIHLFDDDTRSFYSLENLWADAKRVDLTETLQGI